MTRTIEGHLSAENLKTAIVVARFNDFITGRLLEGGKSAFLRHGASEEQVDIVWVPGAFEIPFAAKKLAMSGKYDVVVTLGTVIRGSTPHFDYVCNEAAKGVSHAALESGIPVIFGVLTTNTIEEAVERAGTKAGNKGWEAAVAGIEMANLNRNLE